MKVRCAVYTRKSSDEGLEQEFNSLDAQREACLAYVASQRHEGWSPLKQHYDDGGFSGGSMERPALKQLLLDLEAGKIDVVVIYKIDRLTRSLADFARIIEVLEKAGASFVSVTQSFNTKTSMGRLMLHVLLSFAQFEREVGAERVRDKIAASKAKGMWMGGTVPLGYDAIDRKLVINGPEAATVRAVFAAFLELKSVSATLRWAQQQDLRTKVRQRLDRTVGGTPFHYGALRCLLSNRLYAGVIEHKGKIHPGQHEAIIDPVMYAEAQAILASLSSPAMHEAKVVSASVLQGLITDCHGRTMGPAHTTRSGQRFRYYVTHPKKLTESGPAAYRLAADVLERHCTDLLAQHLAGKVTTIDEDAEVRRLTTVLNVGSQQERRAIILKHVRQVVIADGALTMELVDGQKLHRAFARLRHGNDAKLVLRDPRGQPTSKADPQLLVLLKDAQGARDLAWAKPNLSLEQLAATFGRSPERYKRLLRLSYLSPKIIGAVADGRQAPHVTNRFLQNLDGIPLSWAEQEQLLLS